MKSIMGRPVSDVCAGPGRVTFYGDVIPGLQVGVVDACACGRQGMAYAFSQVDKVAGVCAVETLTALLPVGLEQKQWRPSSLDVLVVRLPSEPQAALELLFYLGEQQLRRLEVRRLVLLSPFAGGINVLLTGTGCPWPVRVVSSRLSVECLTGLVCDEPARLTKVDELEEGALYVRECSVPGRLSWRECLVLRHSIQAVPLYMQECLRHRSRKTLYAQRSNALMKLGLTSVRMLMQSLILSNTSGVRITDLCERENVNER